MGAHQSDQTSLLSTSPNVNSSNQTELGMRAGQKEEARVGASEREIMRESAREREREKGRLGLLDGKRGTYAGRTWACVHDRVVMLTFFVLLCDVVCGAGPCVLVVLDDE